MKSTNPRAVITRALLLGLSAVFAAVVFLATTPSDAAWQYSGDLDTKGRFALHEATAVAVDQQGDVFVADTGAHRMLKFATDGKRSAFGSFGSGEGQLSYPAGVAAQDIQPGKTWVYVADQGNQRISVFNATGKFVKTFGDGQLNNPIGVAVVPQADGSAGDVYVAEDPTHEISVFTPTGKFLRSFTCASCPEGAIHRLGGGISFYAGDPGTSLKVYASDAYYDNYHGRVLVMDPSGQWKLTFGSDSGANQLLFPAGVAVDPLDNSTWVTDGGANKLLRFGPTGEVLVSYSGAGRDQLNDPNGIALYTVPRASGQPALMYLANINAAKVHIYKEAPGRLFADSTGSRTLWTDSQAAIFSVKYNGVEQTCTGIDAGATVKLDSTDPNSNKFLLSKATYSGPITHDGSGSTLQMPLTPHQTAEIQQAWGAGKFLLIKLRVSAQCEDDSHLENFATVVM